MTVAGSWPGRKGAAASCPSNTTCQHAHRARWGLDTDQTQGQGGHAQVRAALLEGARRLGEEELAGLAGCLPSEAERALLAPHARATAGLGAAEQLMLALMAVPQARARAARCSRSSPRAAFHTAHAQYAWQRAWLAGLPRNRLS